MSFFTMKQGETKSNNYFLNSFKSNVQNLELVVGRNFLYSTEHVELIYGEVVTDADNNKEREKFLAICSLKIADLKRCRRLLEQLQESAYLGRDKYPQTTLDVYDTLIRFSGQFNSVEKIIDKIRLRTK